MTTGGTESIMLACKAYRDMAIERGVQYPEMWVLVPLFSFGEKYSSDRFDLIPCHKRAVFPLDS